MQGGVEETRFVQQLTATKWPSLDNGTQLRYWGHRLGHRRIMHQSERTAAALLRWGVRAGDTVLLCLPQIPELLYTVLAIWRLGAVVHVIPPEIMPQTFARYPSATLFFAAEPYMEGLAAHADTIYLPRTVLIPFKTAGTRRGIHPIPHSLPHNESKQMLWKDFLSSGASIRRAEAAAHAPTQAALVCYTAERTQLHLTQQEYACYIEAACTALQQKAGHLRVLSTIPTWQAAGITALVAPLLCGHCLLLGLDHSNDIMLARIFNEKADHIYADVAFFSWALQREILSPQQRAFLQDQMQEGLWRLS